VKGELGVDLLGPEGTGVFLFIHQFDSAHPHITVIEVKVLGVVDGVSDLDSVSDIGRGYLIVPLKAGLKLMVASLLTTRS
jgi:hypothetical protein